MDHDANRRNAEDAAFAAALTKYIDSRIANALEAERFKQTMPTRKVYTARGIKSTESMPNVMDGGYIVRAVAHDGKRAEVKASDLLRSPHDALTLVLAELNKDSP